MQIAMIGLGRMGGNMVRRLLRGGHQCVVFDRSGDAVADLVREGATGASSLTDVVAKLDKPRTVWLMLPAGEITEGTLSALAASTVVNRSSWVTTSKCSSLTAARVCPKGCARRCSHRSTDSAASNSTPVSI